MLNALNGQVSPLKIQNVPELQRRSSERRPVSVRALCEALNPPRRVYMLLSPRALPYARLALQSLFARCIERVNLTLVTDSDEDKATLQDTMEGIENHGAHVWSVFSENDLAEREQARFGAYPHLQAFRHGHPCWRKITDPLLLSADGEEMVLLDPDLYFPNRFKFEPTPDKGVLLMWQKPNCLLPVSVAQRAMDLKIPLAHHVDIGVGGWRAPVDLEWLNWLLGQLDISSAPRVMHVEAIIWSALAMRLGGGHLDPNYWVCWQRTQYKRLARKFGVSGTTILKSEALDGAKCFHAGGEAKNWLADAQSQGVFERQQEHATPGRIIPYIELEPTSYAREQSFKTVLRKLGYYAVFGN